MRNPVRDRSLMTISLTQPSEFVSVVVEALFAARSRPAALLALGNSLSRSVIMIYDPRLRGVDELVALEKRLLCSPLRDRLRR